MSQFEITCPCCQAYLSVDRLSGKVVRHRSADSGAPSFDDFLEEQKKDLSGRWDEKLKSAEDAEKKRKNEIEARFKQAQDNPDSLDGEYHSPFENE